MKPAQETGHIEGVAIHGTDEHIIDTCNHMHLLRMVFPSRHSARQEKQSFPRAAAGRAGPFIRGGSAIDCQVIEKAVSLCLPGS
jgi:hypothetical protein